MIQKVIVNETNCMNVKLKKDYLDGFVSKLLIISPMHYFGVKSIQNTVFEKNHSSDIYIIYSSVNTNVYSSELLCVCLLCGWRH